MSADPRRPSDGQLVWSWFRMVWRESPLALFLIVSLTPITAGVLVSFPWLWQYVVDEVRGRGLMIGLKLHVDNLEMVGRLGGNGLLTVGAADNVVRLLPPLIVEPGHIDEAIGILETSFAEVAG